MNLPRKQVCYRVGGGQCLTGYEEVDCDNVTEVYDRGIGGALVANAVVVPCADCPTEVYVVNSGTTAGAAGQDREVSAWCDPVSGAQVAVVTIWDSAAPAGTAPTVEAYSLDGMPYAGVVSALAKCSPSPGADIETLDQLVCVGGVSYTHTAFVNTATLAQVGSLWRNASGTVVAAPVGVATPGPCPTERTLFVQFRDLAPTTTLTGAAIVADLPAGAQLTSVAIRQKSGVGSVAGADGVLVPMDAGEMWSWNVGTSDEDPTLSPLFDLGAGTGTMRVVTMYRI